MRFSRPPATRSAPLNLPDSLAQRVQTLRARVDLTQNQLAQRAAVPIQTIEELESGLLLFLATPIRQRLARVLRISPQILLEAERPPRVDVNRPLDAEAEADLLSAMAERPTRTYFCPHCGARLQVQTFERRDLEDRPLIAVRAACTACLFSLRRD
ncbi:MAG: helix-turn-helix domain-containing protein [Vampirovibrionales bacterium]|nr:helix-turn-helix domain-containing protein [Vampirovibrionales bacterium]